MDITEAFSILQIEEGKNKEEILKAYRRLLVKTNPEDDTEGFKRLREAYESACRYADAAVEPEADFITELSELDRWMQKVADTYVSLSN